LLLLLLFCRGLYIYGRKAVYVYVREQKRGLKSQIDYATFMARTDLRSQIPGSVRQVAIFLESVQSYFSVFYAFLLKFHNLRKSSGKLSVYLVCPCSKMTA